MACRASKEAGFTLVEILTVLVIIGLMSSIVILSIPTPKSALDKQAEQLTSQLNALAQDGLISGRVGAAGFTRDGYALFSYEDGDWAERHTSEWTENYRIRLERASARIDLPKEITPSIIFQPTGLSTPFELTLSDRDVKYTLNTEGDGRIELVKSVP